MSIIPKSGFIIFLVTSPIQTIIPMHDHQLRFRHKRVLIAQLYIHYNLRLLGFNPDF